MFKESVMIKLGKFVQDKITKIKGVIITRSDHLDRTRTYCIQSQEMNGGKPADMFWVTECRLKVIDDPENRSIGFTPLEHVKPKYIFMGLK